jgi:adenosine deaminase
MLTNEIIKRLPKVEIHHHLDGGLRPGTIIELAREHGITLPAETPEELAKWFHRGANRKSLAQYLEGFAVTVAVLQTREALVRVARETLEDLHAVGVVYAEIRFAPILCIEKGMTLEQVVDAVLTGLREGYKKTGVKWGVILCAMRNQSPALSLEIAELAVAFRRDGVVGFDIAGDEFGHPPKNHLEAFQYIRSRNFNITIHAGEAFGPESIWQAIQICGAHRIGHGTRLIEDMTVHGCRIESMGSLARFVLDHRIPLEICLSSNVQTGAASSLDAHPFGIFFRNRFRVCLCVDNPLMSDTDQVREMELAVKHFKLELGDLERLTLNAMKSSFIPYEERLALIYDVVKPGYAKIRGEMESGQ